MGDALVVKVVESERVTPGGIVIPEADAKRRDLASTLARIVAIGPLAFEAERKHEVEFNRSCRIPCVGEEILIAKYAGYDVEADGEKLRVIWDKDVAAVLESRDE
jgi:co-chaperonin GroES (HSP10)